MGTLEHEPELRPDETAAVVEHVKSEKNVTENVVPGGYVPEKTVVVKRVVRVVAVVVGLVVCVVEVWLVEVVCVVVVVGVVEV